MIKKCVENLMRNRFESKYCGYKCHRNNHLVIWIHKPFPFINKNWEQIEKNLIGWIIMAMTCSMKINFFVFKTKIRCLLSKFHSNFSRKIFSKFFFYQKLCPIFSQHINTVALCVCSYDNYLRTPQDMRNRNCNNEPMIRFICTKFVASHLWNFL